MSATVHPAYLKDSNRRLLLGETVCAELFPCAPTYQNGSAVWRAVIVERATQNQHTVFVRSIEQARAICEAWAVTK